MSKHTVLPITVSTIILVMCFLAFLSVTSQAAAQEPTEKEMCSALRYKFEAINRNLQQTKMLCEKRAYRNNPGLAMQCFSIYGASGGKGNMSVKITRCEKVACEKASSRAGYVCDYVAGIDMPGNVAMKGHLGAMSRNGSLGQGRFVQTKNGWLFIPLNK